MKAIVATVGVLLSAAVLGVVFLWPAQRTGPEAIRYGQDACAQCRMLVSQPGFAAEMRDAQGTLTRYDDVGCLLRAMLMRHGAIPEAWVEDHESGTFVPLLSAHLVRTSSAGTPMGYGIVAFKDEAAAHTFATGHGGEGVSLEDVVRDPDRLVRVGRELEER